jgi:hypothetical protein
MITRLGKNNAYNLSEAGMGWDYENNAEVFDTLSSISRLTATYTRLHEWLVSGHPIHGGEWINDNHDRLDAQDERLEQRLKELGEYLAKFVTGSPKLETHSLYGVTITVTDTRGIERTRDIISSYRGYGK